MPKLNVPATVKNKEPEAKEAKERGPSKQRVELVAQITKFMRKGKTYTSREIVEGLGRTPGSKEGGPVVAALKFMVEQGTMKFAPPAEGQRGQSWVR